MGLSLHASQIITHFMDSTGLITLPCKTPVILEGLAFIVGALPYLMGTSHRGQWGWNCSSRSKNSSGSKTATCTTTVISPSSRTCTSRISRAVFLSELSTFWTCPVRWLLCLLRWWFLWIFARNWRNVSIQAWYFLATFVLVREWLFWRFWRWIYLGSVDNYEPWYALSACVLGQRRNTGLRTLSRARWSNSPCHCQVISFSSCWSHCLVSWCSFAWTWESWKSGSMPL